MDMLLAEEVQQTMATLAPNRFFFMPPYRNFTTSGCFARSDESAVNGDSSDSPFQQKLAVLLADAKAQGTKNPVMVGAIPFGSRRPSSLYILESWQSFSRQEKQASAHCSTCSQSLSVVERQTIPEQIMFEQMVARAAALTATPQVDKVVLSRLIDITTDAAIDSGVLLKRLIARNSVSYNFHVPLADGGILLGASLELLLRKDGERFSSIPLAGPARHQPDEVLDREAGGCLLAPEKDRHEHELITQVMKEVLRKHSSELHVPSSPQLITMLTLWHLATPFEGKANSQENALTLACLLYPTPVLSGSPHQAVTQVIVEPEPFDRELLGGIVGWCDSEGNGEWAVTIRCVKLRENQVRLFAGVGIAPASSPLSEQREVGIKLSIMLNVFGSHQGARMSIPFTRWSEEFARRYREKGYWQDLPPIDILTCHATSDSIAVIDDERQLSYRELNRATDNLVCSLRRQDIEPGEIALVQPGNVAEFYIILFVLLKLGVTPVLALLNHQRSGLNAYANQIESALLIADRQHVLFSGDDFLNTFVAEHSSIHVVQLPNDSGEHNLQDATNHPAEDFTATPSLADEVAYFQLSGGTTGAPKLILCTHNDYYYSMRCSAEVCQST